MSNEYADLIAALVRVAPDIEADLRAQGSSIEPDLEIPTLWMGDVGRAVAHVLDQLSPGARRAVFDVVERYLAGGSERMKDAVATGLLEAVASEVSAGRLDGPALATLLGPASRAYLDAWDQFSLGRSSLDPT